MNVDLDIGGVIVPTTGREPILRREKREIAILRCARGNHGTSQTVSPGTLISVPRGVQHTLNRHGPERVRMLSLHTPDGGFDDYLRRVSGRTVHIARRNDAERSALTIAPAMTSP